MNKSTVRNFARAIAILIPAWVFPATAHAQDDLSNGDTRFLAARDAARAGNRNTLERLANQADGHPLDSYVRYWLLYNRLDKADMPPEGELRRFLADEAGSLLAERLRFDWLRRLAKDGDWSYFLQLYPELQNPDNELRCQAWNARLQTGDSKVLDEVAKSWDMLTFAHVSCGPVMQAAFTQGKVGANEVWRLFRRRVDTRAPSRARGVLAWIDDDRIATFNQAVRAPRAFFDCTSVRKAPPRGKRAKGKKRSRTVTVVCPISRLGNSRVDREIMMAAMTRLAREDSEVAHARFQRFAGKLTSEERAHAWSVLAMHAAQDHKPEALTWFRNAGDIPMSAAQRAWRVRAALRAESWQDVLTATSRLNAEERTLPEWTYWRGRALKALRRASEANKEFQRIANTPNFYGILANEELGQRFDTRVAHSVLTVAAASEAAAEAAADAAESDPAEVAEADSSDENGAENTPGNASAALQAEAETLPPSTVATAPVAGPPVDKHPGFQRALTLFRLDLRMDAIREWNWALRGRDEAFRLAAARLAMNNHLYDRAITSAELANPAGAWELRFVTPYFDLIEPRAAANHLDINWVYGVMRQESRFIIPSRSPTGAQGLMQVMPATGKWVARKLGLYYHPGLLRDPETNVELGTGYMRILLDELEGDQVLAAAGYNAGPGRARRWRAGRPLEGAIYAETIPFDETRDYVKHVMTNTIIYAALREKQPQSLKTRLGTILPKMTNPE